MKTRALLLQQTPNAPQQQFEVEVLDTIVDHAWWKQVEYANPSNSASAAFPEVQWRFLCASETVVVSPLADANGRRIRDVPAFDRLEIYPVRFGYPPELLKEHQQEAEVMFQKALETARQRGQPLPHRDVWIERNALRRLWALHSTPELAKRWLQADKGIGFNLLLGHSCQGGIPARDLDRIQFRADFYSGTDHLTASVFLAKCEVTLPAAEDIARLPSHLAKRERVAELQARAAQNMQAVSDQLANRTTALAEQIAPLTKLYSDVELADIRRRAVGKSVPEHFVEWAMTMFMSSEPGSLPTKGQAYDHCGPGTPMGRKLETVGDGLGKSTFARHLKVLRGLLEEKGWLAPRAPGQSRKRASGYRIDERTEDINQPSPSEQAADRDTGATYQTPDTRQQEIPDPQDGG